MEFFDSFLNLYNTNYEVRGAIKFIGFIIAFICIPELIGNHDSVESFTPAKPIETYSKDYFKYPLSFCNIYFVGVTDG